MEKDDDDSSVDLDLPDLSDAGAAARPIVVRSRSRNRKADPKSKRSTQATEKGSDSDGGEAHDDGDDQDGKRRRLDGQSFQKRRTSSKRRQYRRRSDDEAGGGEPELEPDVEGGNTSPSVALVDAVEAFSPGAVSTSSHEFVDMDLSSAVETMQDDDSRPGDHPPDSPARPAPSSSSSSSSSSVVMLGPRARHIIGDDSDEDTRREADEDDEDDETFRPWFRRTRRELADVDSDPTPEFLAKKPRPSDFQIVRELNNRSNGLNGTKLRNGSGFGDKVYAATQIVQRLELSYKLAFHDGCVNALGFNSSGQILASGSDDLKVALWDWSRKKLVHHYMSGHTSNIFQVKFLPLHGDTHIVTSARDGQVRLGDISYGMDSVKNVRKIAEHHAPVPKVAVHGDEPHVILSAAEDGMVYQSDIRQDSCKKLLKVKGADGERVGLYSISANPSKPAEFCVCGCDAVVRIYDRRVIRDALAGGATTTCCLRKLCPEKYVGSPSKTHVTSAEYNHDGTEIAANYKDDDVYLFRVDDRDCDSTVVNYEHRYEGRRNNATVKSLSFFGPKSEFIVSGSDCGNIFFWDKETEAIVHFVHGDDAGVVNTPQPHPFFPIMASSGLDHETKIWLPIAGEFPDFKEKLEKTVKRNLRERDGDVDTTPGGSQSNMLWMLWRHLRRSGRTRRLEENDGEDSSGSDSSYGRLVADDSDRSEDEGSGRPVCTTT